MPHWKYFSLFAVFIVACSSSVPPCDDTELIIDGVTITAEGTWHAFHFIHDPQEEAPFYVFLDIYVENGSGKSFKGFRATKITLYYEYTTEEFATFDLEPDSSFEIPSDVTYTLYYISTNDYHSNISEGTMLYGCIDVEWYGGDDVFATPASPVDWLP